MRRPLALCAAALMAVLGVTLWLRALDYSDRVQTQPSYRFQLSAIAPMDTVVQQSLREETAAYAFVQDSDVTVKAPQFSRSARVSLLRVLGSAELLFPSAKLLYGAYPGPGIYGCVVDRLTAVDLWGSDQVIGKEITFEGDRYTVTGVMDTTQPLMVIPNLGSGDFSPRYGAYRPGQDAPFPSQELDSFVGRLGLSVTQVTDTGRTGQLLRLAALFPVWLLCMMVGWRCLRQLLPRHLALSIGLLCAVGYGISRVLDAPPLITPDMIPTQWADFSFWSRQASSAAQELQARILSPGTIPDSVLLQGALLPTLAWSALTTLCFLVALRLARAKGPLQQKEETPSDMSI